MLAIFRAARRTNVALQLTIAPPKAIHCTTSESDYASVYNHYTLWFRTETGARGETKVSSNDDYQVRMCPWYNS